MTAAMNGSVNFSTNDGWIVEFVKHGENGFVVPPVDYESMHVQEQDEYDLDEVYRILNDEILPLYYDSPEKWREVVQNGMKDVRFKFDSNRMAAEYYDLLYNG
jgi:starch phosphorylase